MASCGAEFEVRPRLLAQVAAHLLRVAGTDARLASIAWDKEGSKIDDRRYVVTLSCSSCCGINVLQSCVTRVRTTEASVLEELLDNKLIGAAPPNY